MLKFSTPGFNCEPRFPVQFSSLLQKSKMKLFLKARKNNIWYKTNLFNQFKNFKLKPHGLQKGRTTLIKL